MPKALHEGNLVRDCISISIPISERHTKVKPRDINFNHEICLIFRASVPYVLQRKGRHVFRIATECFIHGVIDGQAFREVDANEV